MVFLINLTMENTNTTKGQYQFFHIFYEMQGEEFQNKLTLTVVPFCSDNEYGSVFTMTEGDQIVRPANYADFYNVIPLDPSLDYSGLYNMSFDDVFQDKFRIGEDPRKINIETYSLKQFH